MIKTTIAECNAAYPALRAINETVRLPQDAAWPMALFLGKVKAVLEPLAEAQAKLLRDAGAEPAGNGGMAIAVPMQDHREPNDAFAERMKAHKAVVNDLQNALFALNKTEVEIDADLLPRSWFVDPPETPKERRREFNANQLADAMPFLFDDTAKPA